MAGGSFGPTGVAKERAEQYQGKVTSYVIIACIVAAIGGAIFGYDIGISGGVTSMDDFLGKFFKEVFNKKKHSHENNYCKYNSQGLAAFTSSLYLAGLVATIIASPITRNYGRRVSIICGGISFLIGSALNASAANLAMLIMGRIMLGVGIGFGNQAVPLYLSEMAPTHLRGALNMMFQLATTMGIFTANMINYGTEKIHPWGWRLSLGLAAVPALLMTVGGVLLPETPNSLIEQGRKEEGKEILQKIRGTENVSAEFQDMIDASDFANSIEHPFRNILEKRNRPQLVMAICMPTSGHAQNGDNEEAIWLFREMRIDGVLPDQVTFASVLSACAGSSSLKDGREVHCLVFQTGFNLDEYTCSALVDMYAKCGDVKSSVQVFNEMEYRKDVISWNSMIVGFSKNGYAEDSLRMFYEMRQIGVKPDDIMFLGVLTACSHAGLVSQGLEIFNSMIDSHGIHPRVDHYACMLITNL